MKIRDLSEYPYEVPLFHKILLGVDTERMNSYIWTDYEHPIAYWGNFRKGLKKYIEFLSFLKTIPEMDSDIIEQYIQTTNAFFDEFPDKKSVKFLLEPGEIFELDDEDIPKQAEELFEEIVEISADIDQLLKEKPTDMFKKEKKKYWIWQLQENLDTIAPSWDKVCYYSFNNIKA